LRRGAGRANLGDTKVAVLLENTPAGKDFVKNVVTPIGEGKLGLQITPIFVDSTHPDWTAAVTTAMASHPDGIFGQLTEADCIGMVTATSTLGFKGPVMAGSCTGYIQALGAKAVGTYISSDIFTPATKQYAPAQIQTNLGIYTAAMAADGQSKDDEGFASAAFSSIMELAAVLKTIPSTTPITPASVKTALAGDTDSPGFLGSDLHCANHPLPTETSACRSDILVFKIVKDSNGAIVKQLIGTGFQDVSPLVS
jgi:branched-chain amino acid transport system substrate-binding protein